MQVPTAGKLERVWGTALASRLAERRVGARMADAAREVLGAEGFATPIDVDDDATAVQPGAAFALFGETADGAIFGADGAGAPADRPSGSVTVSPRCSSRAPPVARR